MPKKNFKKIAKLFLSTFIFLVFSFSQQSFCMEEDETRKEKTSRQSHLSWYEHLLPSYKLLKNMRTEKEEDLLKINHYLWKMKKEIDVLLLLNFSLQKAQLKAKETKTFQEGIHNLCSLTVDADVSEEEFSKLKTALLASQVSPFSFADWRKEILSINAPWSKIISEKYSDQKLTSLSFDSTYNSHDRLMKEGIKVLCTSDLSSLTSLSLRGNFIEDDGVKSLVRSNLYFLQTLELENNFIKNDGAIVLASANLPFLSSLGLQNNCIEDAGITVLATCNLPLLRLLFVQNNPISEEGQKIFPKTRLTIRF